VFVQLNNSDTIRIGEPGYSEDGDHPMIVIDWEDITGWRAWVIGAVAVVVMTAVLAALAFLVFGIALSIVAFLVIVMPAVAIVALVGWFFQPRRSRSTPPHGHAHSAVTSTGCPAAPFMVPVFRIRWITLINNHRIRPAGSRS
jgi:hypothetical protein